MLPRVLEPEDMDSREEACDYDAMDHAAVNRVFVADFLAVWDGSNPILDVGTGTAQIPIELCHQAPTAQVVAVDRASKQFASGRSDLEVRRCFEMVFVDHARHPTSMVLWSVGNELEEACREGTHGPYTQVR